MCRFGPCFTRSKSTRAFKASKTFKVLVPFCSSDSCRLPCPSSSCSSPCPRSLWHDRHTSLCMFLPQHVSASDGQLRSLKLDVKRIWKPLFKSETFCPTGSYNFISICMPQYISLPQQQVLAIIQSLIKSLGSLFKLYLSIALVL